jgi:hypothetical protein
LQTVGTVRATHCVVVPRPSTLPLRIARWFEKLEVNALGIGVQARDLSTASERIIPGTPAPSATTAARSVTREARFIRTIGVMGRMV